MFAPSRAGVSWVVGPPARSIITTLSIGQDPFFGLPIGPCVRWTEEHRSAVPPLRRVETGSRRPVAQGSRRRGEPRAHAATRPGPVGAGPRARAAAQGRRGARARARLVPRLRPHAAGRASGSTASPTAGSSASCAARSAAARPSAPRSSAAASAVRPCACAPPGAPPPTPAVESRAVDARHRRRRRSPARARRSSPTSPTSRTMPEFTDHFLVDWHLTREDTVGCGAGARFRVKAPLNRFPWADSTIVELDAPRRIVEAGRGGQVQPHPHARRLRARPGRGGRDPRALHAARPSPRWRPTASWRASGSAAGSSASCASAMRRLQLDPRGRPRPRRPPDRRGGARKPATGSPFASRAIQR